MVALAVGSNGSAVGNITATAAVDSTVSAKIVAGQCEARNAYYTVPLNKTAFIKSLHGIFPAAGSLTGVLDLQMREYGNGWVSRQMLNLSMAVLPQQSYKFDAPLVAPAKTDIRVRCTTSADNADIQAGMQILVVAAENA